MAENEHERSEQPTAKRLEQARERGEVPRSSDLSAAVVLLVAGGAIELLGQQAGGQLSTLMRTGLTLTRARCLDESLALAACADAALHALLVVAPIGALTLLGAVVAPQLLGGRRFRLQQLQPDFTRLDPVAGFARMFSARGAVELVKAFAKFLLLAGVAAALLWQQSRAILGLGAEPDAVAIGHAAGLAGRALFTLAAALAMIAAVDVPWQLWQHGRRLRMTRAQVREELKESEGPPEVKRRIRSLQRELARRRMMHEVPKADVVVVNPSHYAVALRYDGQRMRAPVVVAKGQDLIAARIRAIATDNGVPLFEAPPLARALYQHVEIGAEIPASLYVAVAQVLVYLVQLRDARRNGTAPPSPPTIDPALEPA